MRDATKIIILVIIFSVVFFGIGYSVGFANGIRWSVRFATEFIDLDFNIEQVASAINKYKLCLQSGGCL